MKQKIGTLIDEEIMRLAKRKAAEEGRSLSDLFQDALVHYLSAGATSPKEREIAYHLYCERPMKLTPEQLRQILEEDMHRSGVASEISHLRGEADRSF